MKWPWTVRRQRRLDYTQLVRLEAERDRAHQLLSGIPARLFTDYLRLTMEATGLSASQQPYAYVSKLFEVAFSAENQASVKDEHEQMRRRTQRLTDFSAARATQQSPS